MVEEGYFFPVLSSYFPVYVYSFINEIQAVQNPTGASIPLGQRIKAKLHESRHLYMMEDMALYTKTRKKGVLPRLFKSALQGCPRIWADKKWNFTNEAEQERTQSYNHSSQYHGTFSRRLGKESPCTPDVRENTERNPQNYLYHVATYVTFSYPSYTRCIRIRK
jgi:hypothetical protein